MIVNCISDLHGYRPDLPIGDVLVIAGDSCARTSKFEWAAFANWLHTLQYKHIIVVAGNHDHLLQTHSTWFLAQCPDNVIYLQDEGVVIDGVSFYGTPWTPRFGNWAFMKERHSPELNEIWARIPLEVDVLITHGPPHWIADKTVNGDFAGDEDLLSAVLCRKIRYHVFGHIHEGAGKEVLVGDTIFYNVAYVDECYTPREKNYFRTLTIDN